MLDTKELFVQAGKGGNGAISFLHERFRPRGGPDGGDGGHGGSVYVVARKGVSTLGHLDRVNRVIAEDGRSGAGRDRTGRKGKDRTIEVPVGTVVSQVEEDGTRTALADLVRPNIRVAIARGGEPGQGNHRFSTATNQEPLLAEVGEPGEALGVLLEVKVLGDVALVGAPNAGKSTLLAAVSRAKPKIADYPFTTLGPVLGVVNHRGRDLVFVDVPGLIEGASEGKGLGLDFLKHTERVSVLVHLVDGSVDNVGEEYRRIAGELERYPGGLAEKPRVAVLNKVDLPEVRELLRNKKGSLMAASGMMPEVISGATREGVDSLLDKVASLVPEAQEELEGEGQEAAEGQMPPSRTRRERTKIEREDEVFVVRNGQAERFAPLVNFNNWRARLQFHAELERLGVIEALAKAGVESGDTVRIANQELEWD